jgi:hypothetical protein
MNTDSAFRKPEDWNTSLNDPAGSMAKSEEEKNQIQNEMLKSKMRIHNN